MSVDSQAATLSEGTSEGSEPSISQGEAVAKILQEGWQSPSQESPGTEPQVAASEQAGKPPLDIKSVAEKLGVDPSELYQLRFKTGDGEELSIESIKDRVKKAADLEKQSTEYIRSRGEFEADRIRAQRELDAILASIEPQNVKPELMAERKRQFDDYVSRETEATLRTIPEWADPVVRTAEYAEMEKLVTEYRFTRAELDSVYDHRLKALVRDYAKLKAKVEADKKPPPLKVAVSPKKATNPSPAQQFGRLKASVSQGKVSQMQAVDKILRGEI